MEDTLSLQKVLVAIQQFSLAVHYCLADGRGCMLFAPGFLVAANTS